ncbi:MAG: hypothetical protein HFG24_09715, partial [Anaerotruncus sp.]|nr:hypothetical protein [Anaerotruncus sp.]
YEMFLGPLEQSKPWDTNGIDGVNRFLKKFWVLDEDELGEDVLDDVAESDSPEDKAPMTISSPIKTITAIKHPLFFFFFAGATYTGDWLAVEAVASE